MKKKIFILTAILILTGSSAIVFFIDGWFRIPLEILWVLACLFLEIRLLARAK